MVYIYSSDNFRKKRLCLFKHTHYSTTENTFCGEKSLQVMHTIMAFKYTINTIKYALLFFLKTLTLDFSIFFFLRGTKHSIILIGVPTNLYPSRANPPLPFPRLHLPDQANEAPACDNSSPALGTTVAKKYDGWRLAGSWCNSFRSDHFSMQFEATQASVQVSAKCKTKCLPLTIKRREISISF